MASPIPGGGKPRMPRQPGGPIVDPAQKMGRPMKPLPVKPGKGKTKPVPMKPMPIDDKIYRTMPITEKQLGTIKKMYGIK